MEIATSGVINRGMLENPPAIGWIHQLAMSDDVRGYPRWKSSDLTAGCHFFFKNTYDGIVRVSTFQQKTKKPSFRLVNFDQIQPLAYESLDWF